MSFRDFAMKLTNDAAYIFRGLSPSESEFQFLSLAKSLELYGVSMHTVLVSTNHSNYTRVVGKGLG